MSNLSLAIKGSYRKTMEARKLAILNALREGTIRSALAVKQQSRADILGAGMGRKLANTIQDEVYPLRGLSYSPSAEVFSKAPYIIANHARGGTISPRLADARLIPIKGSPADKIRATRSQTKVEIATARFGELTMIFPQGSNPILGVKVTDQHLDRRSRGLRVGARHKQGKKTFVGLFTMVRETYHKKRLNTYQVFEKGRRRHSQRVVHQMKTYLGKSMQKTAIR